MSPLLALTLLLLAPAAPTAAPLPAFVVARGPVPLLNTPDMRRPFGGRRGTTLRRDRVGLVREVEHVALPGTLFKVEERALRRGVPTYRVTTNDYPFPSKTGLWVDARLVEPVVDEPVERPRHLLHPTTIRCRLLSSVGSLYVWGSNVRSGIPALLDLYPPRRPLAGEDLKYWQLRGVDCSGLLYEATDGWTPRNASALVRFGRGIPVAGLDGDAIADRIRPLDLIVWGSHVILVLDEGHSIQSKVDYDYDKPGNQSGVRVEELRPLLRRLVKGRLPVDDYDDPATKGEDRFVIRRWHPAFLDEGGEAR